MPENRTPSIENFELDEVLSVLKGHRKLVLQITAICLALFMTAAFIIPKKFKSSTVITIYTKYFQNPLVKDYLPEIYDSTELKSQRESLIRQAFGTDFLDDIGEKFKIFKSERSSNQRISEREDLLSRFEVYSLQLTTIQVSFIGSDRDQTQQILSAALSRITKTLVEDRRKVLTRLRDSIRRRIETIALDQGGADPMATERPELLRKELESLEAQIKSLKNEFTDRHPSVARLENRASLIRTWIRRKEKGGIAPAQVHGSMPMVGGEPARATEEVYSDLLKKLNYLNIALDLESESDVNYVGILDQPSYPGSPIWPKKLNFLVWGLISGILLSMFTILLREYVQRSAPSLAQFAEQQKLHYLGDLPALEWNSADGKDSQPTDPNKNKPLNEWH